jgi:dinuclear metal center YbgI/SA1388 family protein
VLIVKDITDLLEAFAPLKYQEPYDNSGLLVGDSYSAIKGILICLDVTEEVLDEAIDLGFNMVISHHPLIFRGIKNVSGKRRVESCLVKAIKNDINIYACHTNADSVIKGVNGKIADKLSINDIQILSDASGINKDEQVGLGIVGNLETEMSETEFLEIVKKTFKCECIRHSAFTGKKVKRIAVCGGSGSEFIEDAVKNGASVFLTGEAKFHEFFTQGMDLMLIDAGHFETEQFTKELFLELISKKFPTFAVRITTMEKNPVKYYYQ